MSQENRNYRIRTQVGSAEPMLHVNMDQTIDMFEILSLNISQTSAYKLMNSDTGLIVGRVVANGGFGVPNAKVSVFVPYENTEDMKKRLMYYYGSPKDSNIEGVRYNLLPKQLDDICHQSVGTFPDKRVVLDNDSWIEIFDKYYKYTTRTNNAGDYMIYGAPIGTQTIHVDVDLSDIGILSQRPRDMVYKGANINQFESPNKFRVDTNLASLAQIFTEDRTIYVYPFWGDTTDSDTGAAVTRCDINLSYKFEPTCIFMGSIITDTGENSLSKKCVAHKNQGKMSDMITGQGTIEMIRKTPDNKVEQYSVQGNQLIDTDGVWCYQIPMNLDYITTDEFGNTVLTDDPNKGIATRARVRFRIGMTETGTEGSARKRARFLVPNNPRLVETDYPNFCETKEIDYEFGSKTKDENFRDLLWNKVYTVKSYIPRLQKSIQPQNEKYLGIKKVNHSNGNNPMPFNNLSIKFNFTYMFLCALLKVLITVVRLTNKIICGIGKMAYNLFSVCRIDIHNWSDTLQNVFYNLEGIGYDDWSGSDFVRCVYLEWKNETPPYKPKGLAKWFLIMAFEIGCGIELEGLCEDENGENKVYAPGSGNLVKTLNTAFLDLGLDLDVTWPSNFQNIFSCSSDVSKLYNCVENQLAQENEVTSFNFVNDWVNGVLYMPLWLRKIKPKRKFLFIPFKAKDQWCSSEKRTGQGIFNRNLKLYRTCAQEIQPKSEFELQPLTSDYRTVDIEHSVRNTETGEEEIVFNNINDTNCYGYQCHTQARTYLPIEEGLITEKETMYGERVYYYRPVEYNTLYNSDLVTLYATDVILLGSLNSCDIHGIPQFFQALSSTTYNMPSDLLVEDYKYDADTENTNSSNKDGYEYKITELTGSDWGNLGDDQSGVIKNTTTNVFDNGGLFYGITCFDSYTKPKSCINLARICEFGISLDESQDILEINKVDSSSTEDEFYNAYENLTPDGYISYDEIYDMDYRSMFATLNSNWLKTKINDNTGLTEYDFNRLYIDNFDGLLHDIMASGVTQESTSENKKANYNNNYNLEKSSKDYIKFRFGNYKKKDNSFMYFYDYNKSIGGVNNITVSTGRRFPRYENSFYFYFGLNEGKTAIDKFRTNFFAECSNDDLPESTYNIIFKPNSWTAIENKGYINFETFLATPLTIIITDKDNPNKTYTATNINNEKFYIGYNYTQDTPDSNEYKYINMVDQEGKVISSLPTGEYNITIIDADENEYHDDIVFQDEKIKYTYYSQAFLYNASELDNSNLETYSGNNKLIDWKTTFTKIAEEGGTNERTIGGTIQIEKITVENFKIYIKPVDSEFFGYSEYATKYKDNGSVDIEYTIFLDENENVYVYYENNNPIKIPSYINENNEVIFTGDYQDYKYSKKPNYAGLTLLHVKNKLTKIDGVGYFKKNDGKIIIGVPYCNQKYRVNIVEVYKNEHKKLIDTDNSYTNIVPVHSRVFTMYINGIDYDLIRNFKTGWEESTVKVMSMGETNFSSDNIYGWNDLDNIGKYIYDNKLKSISLITTNNDNQELFAIGDVLSYNFDGNGLKIYNGGFEYSTPYSWNEEYCYNASEWEMDKRSLNEGSGDKEEIIKKMNEIIGKRSEFSKQVKGKFCYEIDGKTLHITYKSNSTPIEFSCVGNEPTRFQRINNVNSKGNVLNIETVGDFKRIGDTTTNEVISNLPTLTYQNNNYTTYNEKKLPYYFAIRDNNDNLLPSRGNNIDTSQKQDNDIITGSDPDVSQMFGVHIYNKPMYFEVKYYWYGFKNYNSSGNLIKLPGLLIGNIINGIETPSIQISDKTNVDIKYPTTQNNVDEYKDPEVKRGISTKQSLDEIMYYGATSTNNGTYVYDYIQINNINNKKVIVKDGYCSEYNTELPFDFNVDVLSTYFTYRSGLDYIDLNVNNTLSNNVKHYIYDDITKYPYDDSNLTYDENNNIIRWSDTQPMLEFFTNPTINGVEVTTSKRWFIPNGNDPKQFSQQYFVMSVCDDKYYSLSPVIDYTPIRCFALWYKDKDNKSNNKNQNTNTIYLACQIDESKELSWSDYVNIQYLKKGNITITIPQINDDLVNQIDFGYRDIFTKNISIDTLEKVTINISDIEKQTNEDGDETEVEVIKREALQVIKIEFDNELVIADWHIIDIIDCVGIRRRCIMDHKSIIKVNTTQQTSNE